MAVLCVARIVVATLPFKWWRDTLGESRAIGGTDYVSLSTRRFAAHMEWAARLLPFQTKCLPRCMALSWILQCKQVNHCVVFAVRPAEQRASNDQLHAWVEVGNETIFGDLMGDWVETLRLGTKSSFGK